MRDRWRHGCRHRASMDGFTACPARAEGTAQSASTAALHVLTSRRAYVTPAPPVHPARTRRLSRRMDRPRQGL
ncbi:hypothetical protein XocBAI20_07295 [Xanthomonas oryzae pv. oryzicola]|nr:hypothetical protein XocBAI20_07295 [Xanthomonas oryzae pv. oryzicola]